MKAVTLHEMLDDAYVPGPLPADLEPTNRILQRWAVSIGLGLPTEDWDDMPKAKPPPLDDSTAIVVDQIIVRSPPLTYRLIRDWYKRPTPTPTMARNRGIALKSLYKMHQIALNYLRHKFEFSGHPDLVKLLGERK